MVAIPKSKAKHIFLTTLMTFTLLSGFGFVWAVDIYYTDLNGTSDEITLWKSDSNAEYNVYNYKTGSAPYYDFQTAQYIRETGLAYLQWNRTPAYLGNDTWSASVNSTTLTPLYQFFAIRPTLENVNNWVITDIIVNITLNSDPDLIVLANIDHFNKPLDALSPTVSTQLFIDYSAGGITYYNKSYPISLTNSLRIFDITQQTTDTVLSLSIVDASADGFSGWACQWKVEIKGKIVSGWSEQTSIMVGVGLATFCNVLVGFYGLDRFDIGGYVKDIRKRRKSKRRS